MGLGSYCKPGSRSWKVLLKHLHKRCVKFYLFIFCWGGGGGGVQYHFEFPDGHKNSVFAILVANVFPVFSFRH